MFLKVFLKVHFLHVSRVFSTLTVPHACESHGSPCRATGYAACPLFRQGRPALSPQWAWSISGWGWHCWPSGVGSPFLRVQCTGEKDGLWQILVTLAPSWRCKGQACVHTPQGSLRGASGQTPEPSLRITVLPTEKWPMKTILCFVWCWLDFYSENRKQRKQQKNGHTSQKLLN